MMLLAVAAVAVRRGEHAIAPPLPAPDRAQPSAAVPPPGADRAPMTAVPLRSASSIVARAATAVPSLVEQTWIPTELPDSPSLEQKLSRHGAFPDWREGYTYQLGLMAFYEKCMGGRVAHGIIYYYIRWQIDEDHLASSPAFQFGDKSQGDVSKEDELAFAACVKAYLADHDHVYLPDTGPPSMSLAMGAIFPLSDSPLLKMIAEAKNESDRGDASAASASSSGGTADQRK
jgi:hypothetical protein